MLLQSSSETATSFISQLSSPITRTTTHENEPMTITPKVSARDLNSPDDPTSTETRTKSWIHARLTNMVVSASNDGIRKLWDSHQADFARVLIQIWIDQTCLRKAIPYELMNSVVTEWKRHLNTDEKEQEEDASTERSFSSSPVVETDDERRHGCPDNEKSDDDRVVATDQECQQHTKQKRKHNEVSIFRQLPDDIWLQIGGYVSQSDRLVRLAHADRFFYQVANHPSCFSILFVKDKYISRHPYKFILFKWFLVRCGRGVHEVIITSNFNSERVWNVMLHTLYMYCRHITSVKIRAAPSKSSPKFNILSPLCGCECGLDDGKLMEEQGSRTDWNENNDRRSHKKCVNPTRCLPSRDLTEIRTNCVFRPSHLCVFLRRHQHLTVLKASVRYKPDWMNAEMERFWEIPTLLPPTLEIFFLPGHTGLPESWIVNCLSRLKNLKYLDFFIVNDSIPRMSDETLSCLATNCHQLEFCHVHLHMPCLFEDVVPVNSLSATSPSSSHLHYPVSPSHSHNGLVPRNSSSSNLVIQSQGEIVVNGSGDIVSAVSGQYVASESAIRLTESLQKLFSNCLKLSRLYLYLPHDVNRTAFIYMITPIKLPKGRRCRFRMDDYTVGSSSLQYFRCSFKIGDV